MRAIYSISIVVVILATYASGCKNKSDLRGDATIAGTLYFVNTLDGLTDSSVVPNATLYIQDATVGTASYLYAAQTDANGRFLFSNLVKAKAYNVFTTLDTFGISYTAIAVVTPIADNITLNLSPVTNATNGFIVRLKDPLHMPVGVFPVYGFNSQSLADYNDSSGAIFPMITDIYGYVYRFNIAPGWYYLNAKGVLDNIAVSGRDSFLVPASQVIQDSLVLDTAVNGFQLRAVDPQQGPVAGLPLYVFNSSALFTADTTVGYVFRLTTNGYGVAELLNIQAGTYYIKAWDTIGHVIVNGKDTVTVRKTGIVTNTFGLQATPIP
jgi:hypothetical protein